MSGPLAVTKSANLRGGFGVRSFESFDNRKFIEEIAFDSGVPIWSGPVEPGLVCGPRKADRDMRDFVYFSSHNGFRYCGFLLPPHVDISEINADHQATIDRVGIALLGDVLASRLVVLIRGELVIPELEEGYGRRPFGTIGMRCLELGVSLEYQERKQKRINPISDSVGEFIIVLGNNSHRAMSNDSHVPRITLPKVRQHPWIWPLYLVGADSLSTHKLIRVLGRMDFWEHETGYHIS